MARLRLLERLNQHSHERSRRGRREEHGVERSVCNHVGEILSTRRGGVPLAPDFGIATSPEGSGADPTETVREAIRETVSRYEPRLEGVEVEVSGFGEQAVGMRVSITGRLKGTNRRRRVNVTGSLLVDGRFVQDRR